MIPLKYRNKEAILIATGPSLDERTVDIIRKYKDRFIIFGCNDSYRLVDFLNVHYACDKQWWSMWGEDFKRERPNLYSWTQDKSSAIEFKVNYTNGKHQRGMSLDGNFIHFGSNSGYQLLNLAFLMGCKKFILVGYNMQVVDNKRHFFGDHPKGLNNSSPYPRFIKAYETIQPAIKELVVNCTPNSALTCFRQNDLEKELRL